MADDRRRRPRTLTDEEHALWHRVARTTDRGAAPIPAVQQAPELPQPTIANKKVFQRPRPKLVSTTSPRALTGSDVEPVGRPEAGLDRRTATRLRKGAREPDARIDLHGLSAERAHRACLTFLGDALARGCRVVLVITGKGRSPDDPTGRGRGVIRESLPGWLHASPLGRSVVGIYQAHQKHGGAGAFYVYLKRNR